MSDRRLRAAAREGAAEALRERLRAGLLSRERLWVAAALGSEEAAEALGEGPPAVAVTGASVALQAEAWLAKVRVAGEEALVQVAIAAAASVDARYREVFAGARTEFVAQACVQAARDCLRCPCPAHRQLAEVAAAAGEQVLLGLTYTLADDLPNPPHTEALQAACHAARALEPEVTALRALDALLAAAGAESAEAAILPATLASLCERIAAELIPRLLGDSRQSD